MFAKLLAALSRILSEAGIRHVVVGGQAVLVHGEFRVTKDIDVTVLLDALEKQRLLDCVRQGGWRVLPQNPGPFVDETLVLPVLDETSGIRVDFIFGLTRFEQEAVSRALKREILDVSVPFLSAEDLVIQKILAGRPRDLEDIKGVVLKNPSLDRSFIEKILGEFARDLELPLIETWRKALKDLDT